MPSTDTTFTRSEWTLLVRLPGQVVAAATAAGQDHGTGTVAQALAGLDAIAAGRGSPNALVRNVVGAIYAERDAEVGSVAGHAAVVDACRQASEILAVRSLDDRDAYRGWVLSAAERTCGAGRPGGSPGGDARRLLADLAGALGG
ncbi:MAG TPA: hypothetical protein VKB69_07670 [Micromonosporaceae bacterium]|nr:hypothetical protein [Micromonosporaceae bacterium]